MIAFHFQALALDLVRVLGPALVHGLVHVRNLVLGRNQDLARDPVHAHVLVHDQNHARDLAAEAREVERVCNLNYYFNKLNQI